MDKNSLKDSSADIAATIKNNPKTLNCLFDEVCQKYPNSRAFTCDNHSINYTQTYNYVNNLAASFIELGIKKGDRIAVIMPNIIQYPLAIFAILKIGGIVVNINPLYTSSEIDYLLANSGAKVVIVLDMMAHKLNKLYNKYAVEHVIVTKLPDMYPFFKRCMFNFAIKYIKRLDVSYAYKAHSFKDMALNPKPLVSVANIKAEDIAFIQYTGATTGKPKGAMLLHRNIIANLTQMHCCVSSQLKPLNKHIVIDALPLYHIFSLTANLFIFFFDGSENVMVTNPRDVKALLRVLNTNNFTIFSALDTLYNHLLNSPEFVAHKFPYFKYSVAGGMPLRKLISDRWAEVTGVIPTNCYGLTEASPTVTMNELGSSFDGSVGYPIPATDIEIRDLETGELLPEGKTGIIWIRGPQLMSGYWNDPEQTKMAIDENGWFNTKDLGYFEEGKLFLNGRQSEMVIVSGFNVYPAEVETVIDALPEIKDSAVVGIPDDETGEALVAFIVFKQGSSMQESEIIKACGEKLTRYKVPRHIRIVEDLPKTLVGKVDKAALIKSITKQ